MASHHDDAVQIYEQRLEQLYTDIHSWLTGTGMQIGKHTVDLDEEAYGRYQAAALIITDATESRIAEIRPVGASIIAAEGRVDIVGPLDKQIVVYLLVNGPQISHNIIEGERVSERRERPLFSGVHGDGWYWIEETRLGRARRLDKELFQDLLSEVSDHVFQ